MVRTLVEAMEIPIFNRVTQLNYSYKDLSDIPLDKADVARLRELERISVSKRNRKQRVNESDVKLIRDFVPPCRLASMNKTKNQIDIKVAPGSTYVGCAQ